MVKSQKAMDMEFNDQRRSKKPKQLVGEIKPAEPTVAIDEPVAAKQSLLKDAKAAYTKVTKVIDEALTATVGRSSGVRERWTMQTPGCSTRCRMSWSRLSRPAGFSFLALLSTVISQQCYRAAP